MKISSFSCLLLSAFLLSGCNSPPTQPDTSAATAGGFIAIEYGSLSSTLNMDPRGVADYLLSETYDFDLSSSIMPVGSDGIIAKNDQNQAVYQYYQTYHDAPVWNTKIELLWDGNLRLPVKAKLLVVNPTYLSHIELSPTISQEVALTNIEKIFLSAENAETYEIAEPIPVYYYHSLTNQWHYGWGSTILSHHSGYDRYSGKLVEVNLEYSIIVDAISGEQLLLEFAMKN